MGTRQTGRIEGSVAPNWRGAAVDGEATLYTAVVAASVTQAAVALERWQVAANFASLHPDVYVQVKNVSREYHRVVVSCGVASGVLLSDYVPHRFGEYMADENFCLELLYRLADHAQRVGRPVAFKPSEVWLSDDGKVRLLPSAAEPVTERVALRASGHLLFDLLTRQNASDDPVAMLSARELNGEISTTAESVIRRCVQGVESGGFSRLASLRYALLEALRARGRVPAGENLTDFSRHPPRTDLGREMNASVRAQKKRLDRLREACAPDRFLQSVHALFGVPEKQGFRPLWSLLAVGYLVMVIPLALSSMPLEDRLSWAGIALVSYLGATLCVMAGYRRRQTERSSP